MSNRIDLTQFEARTKGPWAALSHEDYPEGEAPANEHLVVISSQYGVDEKDQPHWESLSVATIDNRWAYDGESLDTRLEYSRTEGTTREMLDANAKAIAAVPDLIAELKRCYDLIDKMQHSIVKNRGDCWDCDMPIDSCDARTCERQMLEDIELGTASE